MMQVEACKTCFLWLAGIGVGLFLVLRVDAAPPPTGAVTGRVVTIDGKPVSGARVRFEDSENESENPHSETRSDAQGYFRLGPIPAVSRFGDYYVPLLVDAQTFAREYIPGVSVFPGTDNEVGSIVVRPGRHFVGQVIDTDGKPRGNARVELRICRASRGHSITNIGTLWLLMTAADGRFRTPPLPPGVMILTVRVPDRCLTAIERIVSPGSAEESLEPIQLEKDEPMTISVRDPSGRPIPGARARWSGAQEVVSADPAGSFVIRGCRPGKPSTLVLRVAAPNFMPETQKIKVMKQLTITLTPAAWITGRAFDAVTNQPVRLSSVMLCQYQRQPDGSVVRRGCRSGNFEQPENGRFRIPFVGLANFLLTLKAEGYRDTETFVPPLKSLTPIDVGVVKLQRNVAGTPPPSPKQQITGRVTREGNPVTNAWVTLWVHRARETDAVNVFIRRGRTVPLIGEKYGHTTTSSDGAFTLEVPFQHEWLVVIEEAMQPPTIVGPVNVRLNEERRLAITCTSASTISGRVKNFPPALSNDLWVVAFNHDLLKVETRVAPDGSFRFDRLPPGLYGLKVGYDGLRDSEVPQDTHGNHIPPEAWSVLATPWHRATSVTVGPRQSVRSPDLTLPAP